MYLQEGGDVFEETAISSMLEGTVPADEANHIFGGSASYGMGWISTTVNGSTVYYCTGKSKNSTTAMFLLPEQKLGVTLLFNSADYFNGQELFEKLEKGIISIELEKEPETFKSGDYFTHYIFADIGLILAILAAWMPIILMGVWTARRRNHVASLWGIIIDVLIHIILPTVMLLIAMKQIPLFFFHRIYPDIFYVFVTILGTLYLGGVIKLIAMIAFCILGPKEETESDEEEPEIETEDEKEQEKASDDEKKQEDKKESGDKKKTEDVKEPEDKKKAEVKKESGDKKKIEDAKEDKKDIKKESEGAVKKVEVKSANVKETSTKKVEEKTDAKKATVKKADVKDTEVKKADVKEGNAKKADVKEMNTGKTDVKEAEVKKADVADAAPKKAEVKKRSSKNKSSSKKQTADKKN